MQPTPENRLYIAPFTAKTAKFSHRKPLMWSKAGKQRLSMHTHGLLTVLFAPTSPLLVVDGFLRVTKDFRMVIFYNKKLKNSYHLLGNRVEPLKYAVRSGVFCCTMCEEAFLETRKSIFS